MKKVVDFLKFLKKNYKFYGKRSKLVFNGIYSSLISYDEVSLYDYGIDWLKLNSSSLLCGVEDLFIDYISSPDSYLNSSTGNYVYGYSLNYDLGYSFDYDLNFYKSPTGYTIQFIGDFMQYGLPSKASLFDITYVNSFNTVPYYLVNIYGLAFQLDKIGLFDIRKYVFSLFNVAKVTRVDFNYNFQTKKNPSYYISAFVDFMKKYLSIGKGLLDFEGDSLSYRLYESAGKTSTGKVKYRMTHRFGLRLYNKSKQLYDARIVGFYPQYEGKNILRLEGILGIEYLGNVYLNNTDVDLSLDNTVDFFQFNNLNDLFSYFHNFVLGSRPLYKFKESKSYKNDYIEKMLSRSASDIGSRIETFVSRGGNLNDIIVDGKPLPVYIEEYLPETIYF